MWCFKWNYFIKISNRIGKCRKIFLKSGKLRKNLIFWDKFIHKKQFLNDWNEPNFKKFWYWINTTSYAYRQLLFHREFSVLKRNLQENFEQKNHPFSSKNSLKNNLMSKMKGKILGNFTENYPIKRLSDIINFPWFDPLCCWNFNTFLCLHFPQIILNQFLLLIFGF